MAHSDANNSPTWKSDIAWRSAREREAGRETMLLPRLIYKNAKEDATTIPINTAFNEKRISKFKKASHFVLS